MDGRPNISKFKLTGDSITAFQGKETLLVRGQSGTATQGAILTPHCVATD